MKNYPSKPLRMLYLILKLVRLLGIISLVGFIILEVFLLSSLLNLSTFDTPSYINLNNHQMFIVIAMYILATLIIIKLIEQLILILKNIVHKIFFSVDNLMLIKRMALLQILVIGIDILHVLYFSFLGFPKVPEVLDCSKDISDIGLLGLAITFVVYLVFKEGLALKSDNDTVI